MHAMKAYGGVKLRLHTFLAILGCYSKSAVKWLWSTLKIRCCASFKYQ